MIDLDQHKGKTVTEIALTVQQYQPLAIPKQINAKTTVGNILHTKTVYHDELFLGGIPVYVYAKHITEGQFNTLMDQLRAQLKDELRANGLLR